MSNVDSSEDASGNISLYELVRAIKFTSIVISMVCRVISCLRVPFCSSRVLSVSVCSTLRMSRKKREGLLESSLRDE